MKFIKLTYSPTGESMLLNTEEIQAVFGVERKESSIWIKGAETTLHVKESVETIHSLLKW